MENNNTALIFSFLKDSEDVKDQENLLSKGKKSSIKCNMLLHRTWDLTQNLISDTLQFITSREEFIVEEVKGKRRKQNLKKAKLRNLVIFQISYVFE